MPVARPLTSRLISALVSTMLIVQSVSCGSILYPERIGQPRGPLDPKVVALDTAGLLLFFVPGAIAFAVDFYNGTIYMPQQGYRGQSPDAIPPERWTTRQLDSTIDSRDKLQEYLQRETGKSINLDDETIRVIPLDAVPSSAPVQALENPDQSADEQVDWKKLFDLNQSHKKPRT